MTSCSQACLLVGETRRSGSLRSISVAQVFRQSATLFANTVLLPLCVFISFAHVSPFTSINKSHSPQKIRSSDLPCLASLVDKSMTSIQPSMIEPEGKTVSRVLLQDLTASALKEACIAQGLPHGRKDEDIQTLLNAAVSQHVTASSCSVESTISLMNCTLLSP